MNEDLYQSLPDDLPAGRPKETGHRVEKLTNNVGVTVDASPVTVTSDLLWAPSAVELLGEVGWWTDDNGSQPFYDDIYSAAPSVTVFRVRALPVLLGQRGRYVTL